MSDIPQELIEALNNTNGIVVKHVMELEADLKDKTYWATEWEQRYRICQNIRTKEKAAMSETQEQLRFRIFALTHKKPTQAADEWLADKAQLAELYTLVERTCGDGCHCMAENNGNCALAALLPGVK